MALKQQLQQKQQQRLSPLQMQVIKLTELPNVELEERIKQELVDNPALDEGHDESDESSDLLNDNTHDDSDNITQEDIAMGDYLTEEDIPDYSFAGSNTGSGAIAREDIPFSSAESLHESLIEQLHLTELDAESTKIAEYIIGNIDDNGYLDRPLTAIADDLLFQQNLDIPANKIEKLLQVIQEFDPPGVGARDLQQCLLLQLQRLPANDTVSKAEQILQKHFDDFSKRHFEKIKRSMALDDEQLKHIVHLITTLNPKPGNNWGDALAQTMNTVIPDFIVESYNGEIYMSLNNRNIPELRVNREYSEMLRGYSENKQGMSAEAKNAALFVKQKLDSARWFIDAIKQRQGRSLHGQAC